MEPRRVLFGVDAAATALACVHTISHLSRSLKMGSKVVLIQCTVCSRSYRSERKTMNEGSSRVELLALGELST
eukprot:6203276-Pleurochrysis_carterae.AAC.2